MTTIRRRKGATGDRPLPQSGPAERLIDLNDVRHAAEVDFAGAVTARNEAIRLMRQAAAMCAVAIQSNRRAARSLRQAARMRADARLDELTGALRRGAGYAALNAEIDRARREGASLVLGFLDVDGLKVVNDNLGHLAGDELLTSVQAALRASLRSYDVVVRYGGDEFVYSLAGADLQAAAERFQTMRTLLEYGAPGRTVSAGFAELRPDDDLESLIRRADDDMLARRQAARGLPRHVQDGPVADDSGSATGSEGA